MSKISREKQENFYQLMEELKEKYPHRVAFQYKKNDDIEEKTFLEFYDDSHGVKQGILGEYGEGQRIGIIGKTSYQWLVTYVAVILSGGVAIPIDNQLTPKAVATLLGRAEADSLFYDVDQGYSSEWLTATSCNCITMNESTQSGVKSWEKIKKIGFANVSQFDNQIDGDALKTSVLLYTSGTTGESKGVCLTQKGILTIVRDSTALILMEKTDKVLSLLPVNHAYELHCGVFPILSVGGCVAINDSLRNVSKNMALFQPNSLFIVPLIAEMFYKKIWENAKASGKEKKLHRAIAVNNALKKYHIDLSQVLFKQVREAFGGKLKRIVCGGANLNPKIAQGFTDLGFMFSEGYGITECGPLVSVNPEGAGKIGSLGVPLKHCQVMIDKEEILVKGEILANGYYKNPQATEEVFQVRQGERWFRTGDLGSVDQDGYLYISGRKKNLIILANGENVSPEALEEIFVEIVGIEELVIYQRQQQIVAEIFPSAEYIGRDIATVQQYFYQEVMKVNKTLPAYQRLSIVDIRQSEFPKTTTKKIKRPANVPN